MFRPPSPAGILFRYIDRIQVLFPYRAERGSGPDNANGTHLCIESIEFKGETGRFRIIPALEGILRPAAEDHVLRVSQEFRKLNRRLNLNEKEKDHYDG